MLSLDRSSRSAAQPQDLTHTKLRRRDFIKQALAFSAALSSSGPFAGTAGAATAPKRGGLFRVGMQSANVSDSLDPATTASIYMIQMNHAFRSYLTEITPTNKVGADAAESWDSSPDATKWTFKLAKNITFHNGKPFTANDAVASLNYHRGGSSKSAAKPLLEDVAEIKADGTGTVVITLKSGNADLPYLLSDYHLVMMPSDDGDKVDFSSGIGTGPFKILKHDPGVGSHLQRFDNYFRDVWFDGVQLIGINDVIARQAALQTSAVDAISEVDLKSVEYLKAVPGIEIDDLTSAAHATLPMFCDTAPFDNIDVRLALKYAIDRDEQVKKICSGHGTLGNDHPIGRSLPYWANLEQRVYDPDKAKFHLKKAGAEGLTVTLSASEAPFGGAVDMAILYSEQAAKAGITINVVREPVDGYWDSVWLKKPFITDYWGARPTPDVIFSIAYKDDAPWNESHWKDPEFNSLLRAAKAELDQAKRADMYRQMQSLCRDDGGTIVPFFRNTVFARRSNVIHGPDMASNWALDGARCYQRWWFA
jgi:peptide/nickel transport system substrate-binding protein